MCCRKQALRSAAAAGQMQPSILEEDRGFEDPIDEPEIKSEAMAVGLIAADRLASLLLHNSEVGPRPGLKVSPDPPGYDSAACPGILTSASDGMIQTITHVISSDHQSFTCQEIDSKRDMLLQPRRESFEPCKINVTQRQAVCMYAQMITFLQDISAAMLAILQQVGAPKSSAGPESRERAARIATFLTPLAIAAAPSAEAGEAINVQTEFGAKLYASPNWPLDEG